MNSDFQQFIKTYLSICIESTQNDVISDENMISKPMSSFEIDRMFASAELINPENDDIEILYDPENDVLMESKNFNDILDLIMNASRNEIFTIERIKKSISKKWHLLKRFQKCVKPFYVFKFHFDNEFEISWLIENFMNADKESAVSLAKKWKNKLENSSGMYMHSDFNDLKAICINESKQIDRAVVVHEFTHYLQDILHIDIAKFKNTFQFDPEKISFLKLNDAEINSLKNIFNEKEIMPYANEFIETSIEIFRSLNTKIPNLKAKPFIDYVNMFLLSEKLYESDFYNMYSQFSTDPMPMYVYICCLVFKIKKSKVLKRFEKELKAYES